MRSLAASHANAQGGSFVVKEDFDRAEGEGYMNVGARHAAKKFDEGATSAYVYDDDDDDY